MLSKENLKKLDKLHRQMANASHRTYQSLIERKKKGWMPQWYVNKILGRYEDR